MEGEEETDLVTREERASCILAGELLCLYGLCVVMFSSDEEDSDAALTCGDIWRGSDMDF